MQEVGEPEALADLVARLDGEWEVETGTVFEPGHPIRVGVLSRTPVSEVEQVSEFPARLRPVQADDAGDTLHAMPRGALRVRDAAALDLVICHLKSKLLTFPGGRFSPRDEGERARYAAYALQRRGAEAATVRAAADRLLDGAGTRAPGGGARRPQRRAAGGDDPDPARPAGLRARHGAASTGPTAATPGGCGTSRR